MKKKDTLRKLGQGALEYLIILALIGVGSVFIMKKIGNNTRRIMANANSVLTDSRTKTTLLQTRRNDFKDRSLSNFHKK